MQVPGEEYMSSWFSEKFTHGLDFPNLPYYMDDKVKLTQSHVIGHYIGRKYGLCAETEKDKTTSEMLQGACNDIFMTYILFCYSPKFHEEKDDTLKELKIRIKQFEDFLKERPWFIGSKLTWVDFWIYETLNQTLCCWSDILNDFPRLSAYMKRFEELPAIKAYMSSPDFMTKPLYQPKSHVDGK